MVHRHSRPIERGQQPLGPRANPTQRRSNPTQQPNLPNSTQPTPTQPYTQPKTQPTSCNLPQTRPQRPPPIGLSALPGIVQSPHTSFGHITRAQVAFKFSSLLPAQETVARAKVFRLVDTIEPVQQDIRAERLETNPGSSSRKSDSTESKLNSHQRL